VEVCEEPGLSVCELVVVGEAVSEGLGVDVEVSEAFDDCEALIVGVNEEVAERV